MLLACVYLTIILTLLKLLGLVSIDWFWVLSPTNVFIVAVIVLSITNWLDDGF